MAYTGKYHSIPSFIIIGSFKVNKLDIILFCQLVSIFDKKTLFKATCATSGDGLYEGLDWLSGQLQNAR